MAVPGLKRKTTPLTRAVFALMALEIVLAVLSLILPWGETSGGTDIRFGLAGLLPWFGFVPVLLQAGCLVVESPVLRAFYLVANFLAGAFLVFVQGLTHLRYSSFQAGFYLVFALGGVAILAGAACWAEGRERRRPRGCGRASDEPVAAGSTGRPT